MSCFVVPRTGVCFTLLHIPDSPYSILWAPYRSAPECHGPRLVQFDCPAAARMIRPRCSNGSNRPPFVQTTAQQHLGRQVQVWFQDEARVGQQGTLTRCRGLRGSRPTAAQRTEYEWVYLFGAVNSVTGHSSVLLAPTVSTEYMNHHLRFLREQAGPEVQAILVPDRAGWHVEGSGSAGEYDAPVLAPVQPELNTVERLWAYLCSHHLSNRVCQDYDDLPDASGSAWNKLTPEQLCSICRTEWIPRQDQS